MDRQTLEPKLAEFIREKAGAKSVTFTALTRLSGGASRHTWSFDADIDHGDRVERLEGIYRADPVPGVDTSAGRRLEFTLLKAAFENGCVVPEPLWDGGPEHWGVHFFIMRRVREEALGARLIRQPQYEKTRQVLTADLGRSLARIHSVDYHKYPALLDLPMAPPGKSPAGLEIDTYENNLRNMSKQPHPVFEYAMRWLRQRLPVVEERVLVHGDYRLGNMMYDENGLTGVIDWELAHFGDPMEDLGWLCVKSWRFGGKKPVAGVGEREELFAAYESAGGAKVDPERVRFWEILGNLKWGIITIMQGGSYLDGRNRNVEHATIGRRPAETEIELLELLEGQ